MLQRPKSMFISGLIAGMLILALIAGVIVWNSGQASAGNHWKVETTNYSDSDNLFLSERDFATRVSQISAKCRVQTVLGNGSIMLLDGCP